MLNTRRSRRRSVLQKHARLAARGGRSAAQATARTCADPLHPPGGFCSASVASCGSPTTPCATLARSTPSACAGARLDEPGHGAALPRLSDRIAGLIADFGWHVQFYPHGDDLPAYAERLLALPTPVVLDHFAAVPAAGGVDQPAFGCLLRLLDSGRVWVKLSGPMRCTAEDPPYASVVPLARALVRHAPQRLVWGSDWPHVNMNGRAMPNDGDLFDLLGQWVEDAQVLQRILVEQPRALYGFGAA